MRTPKAPRFRITVSKVDEDAVYGAFSSPDAHFDDASIWRRWRCTLFGLRLVSTVEVETGPKGVWMAVKGEIPLYLAATMRGLARTLMAAKKKNVQLPIDYFDPRGKKRHADGVVCSPDGE